LRRLCCFLDHSKRASKTGLSAQALSVIAYSTLGGTSAKTSRLIRPSASSSRSCAVSMCCVTPGIERRNSLDILKTNFAGDIPTLYHNEARGVFDDAVREAGLAVENRYAAWGAGMCDLDNDGLADIFIVAGHVYPEIEGRFPQFPMRTPRLLFHNIGHGRLEQVMAGAAGNAIDDPHCSRGCAFGDFDNDGDLDILIVNLNESPTLLRNDVPGTQHWLKIRLIGVRSNRSAIGARVVVETAESMQT
jgi:enediyne biosynthesis protein E4